MPIHIDEAPHRDAYLSCGKLHKTDIFRRHRCLQINRNAQTQRIPLGEAEMNTMEHTLCEGALAAAAAAAVQKEKTPRSAMRPLRGAPRSAAPPPAPPPMPAKGSLFAGKQNFT